MTILKSDIIFVSSTGNYNFTVEYNKKEFVVKITKDAFEEYIQKEYSSIEIFITSIKFLDILNENFDSVSFTIGTVDFK